MVLSIQAAGFGDQDMSQLRIDTPVAVLVGLGQGAARNGPSDSSVIEFRAERSQTGFDIAQTVAKSQLRKGHAEKLIEAGKRSDAMIATVALNALLKGKRWEPGHDLGKNGVAYIHGKVPPEQEGSPKTAIPS